MPKFTGSLALVSLNSKTALRALQKELDKILLEGAREWFRTVDSIVPTWSGMSRASLEPIADKLEIPFFVGVDPAAPDRRSQGRELGSSPELESTGGIFKFSWRSDVFHLIYNEFHDATAVGFRLRFPGPYHAQDKAAQAFRDEVNERLAKVNARVIVRPSIKLVRIQL